MKLRTIAIIPARGGSKGLPDKNVLALAGRPLISHSVSHALLSNVCDRVLVTTDSERIREAALEAGAWVPFMRAPSLAEDLTPTEPVLTDALARAEALDGPFDVVVFLQPTDIFRKPEWIARAIHILEQHPEIESAFTVAKTHKNFWIRDGKGKPRRIYDWMAVYGPRQTRQPLYREDTGIACASRAHLIREGRRIGDKVELIETDDSATGIDIHTAFDFWLAEQVIRNRSDE